MFTVIQEGVTEDAAERLQIKEVEDEDTGAVHHYVEIKGDIDEFRDLGETERNLADVVAHEEVVELGFTKLNLAGFGGAATLAPGEMSQLTATQAPEDKAATLSPNENVRSLINEEQLDEYAGRFLHPRAPYAGYKFAHQRVMGAPARFIHDLFGKKIDPIKWADDGKPWAIGPFTESIGVWHELGHAFGMIQGRTGAGESMPDALKFENDLRERMYGPLGPKNAPRILD